MSQTQFQQLTLEELKKLLNESLLLANYYKQKLAGEKLPSFLKEVMILQEEIQYWPTLKHVQEWCQLVMTEKKLLVEASRDHFKSTFFSVGYPLYCVNKVKKNTEAYGIALFSYSEGQAQKNLKRVRQEIENNPKL